jgi:hypothetical protein
MISFTSSVTDDSPTEHSEVKCVLGSLRIHILSTRLVSEEGADCDSGELWELKFE